MKILLLIAVILFILFSLKRIKKNHAIKKAGKTGERETYETLKSICKEKNYPVFRNLEIPLYDGKTEIDLLIVTNSGLMVIENKNLSGRIQGNPQLRNWKQLKKSGETKRFYNPIMQNEGHIKCLNHNLSVKGHENIRMDNVVIFSNPNVEIECYDRRIKTISEVQEILKRDNRTILDKESIRKTIKSFQL